jgi:hypothetical protein
MGHVGHLVGDDLFLATIRYAPMLFVIAGIAVVWWLARQRLPSELQPDVLAALSDTEALSLRSIRDRSPLAHQDVDIKTLTLVLDMLCASGQAVRWYENVDSERQIVYRRVALAISQADVVR